MSEVSQLSVVVKANVGGAVTSLKTVQGEFSKTGASAKKMDAQITASSTSTRRAASGYTMLGTSAAGAAKQTEKLAPAASKGAAATSKMGAASRGAQSAVTAFGGSAVAMQGGVLLAGYAIGKTVKTAVDFDAAMRNVNSIAGLSEGQFQKLSGSVRDLAGTTAQTPQTLATGLYDLVSSGFEAGDALNVLEASANAATAGLTTTEVSTAAVAAVLNAYQMPAKKAGEVSDTLFKTVDRGVISFDQLAQNIGDVLPFSSSLGVSLNEVGASISTMTKGGINPAETMTRIKAVMTALISPSKELKATMTGLGYESATSMLKARGFQGTIDALARSTGGSKEKLAQLFPNVRALGGVMALTGNKAKAASADVASFKNTVGATQKALSEQKKSTQFKFNQAKADAEALAVTVGSALLPALSDAAQNASKIAAGIEDAGNAIDSVAGKGSTKKAFGFLTTGWNDIAGEAKNVANKISGMASQAWNGKKPAKVQMSVVPKVDNSSLGSVKKQIDAAGKGGKVSLSVTTNAKKISPQLKEVSDAAKEVGKAKATTKVTTPGAAQARAQFAQLLTDIRAIPASKTVNVTVKTTKVGSHASGGMVTTSLARVNEQGAESLTNPVTGATFMLGDGRETVMPLPLGWRVNTAAETKGMFPAYAKGGKVRGPKRRPKEKLSDYRSRYNAWVDRSSTIKDYRSDEAISSLDLVTNPDGTLSEDTAAIDAKNVSRANRHLAEAKRKKGPERKEAIARAKAEIAEAKKRQKLDAAQAKSLQDNTAALQAQADALKANSEELKKNREYAKQMSSQIGSVTDETMQGILDRSLGGWLSSTLLLYAPRVSHA